MRLDLVISFLFSVIFAIQLLNCDKMITLARPEMRDENAIRYLEELDKFYTQKGRPRFGKRMDYRMDNKPQYETYRIIET